jgi:hypothetical protein
MPKKRLDVLLVERGLAESRAQAQALVLAGRVPGYTKAGSQIEDSAELEVEPGPRFVSRGGEKLAHALEQFGVDVSGEDCPISERRPGASPIVSCRRVQRACARSTSATASSIRASGRIRV